MNITIPLNALDANVFKSLAADPQEWAANFVRERVRIEKEQIAQKETAWRRDNGAAPLSSVDDLVASAFNGGRVPMPEGVEAPPVLAPRVTQMWRARAVMKLTPHGSSTLFDAVVTAIDALTEPNKTIAREAIEYGNVFDRDGVFAPVLADELGLTETEIDDLMRQAEALPA